MKKIQSALISVYHKDQLEAIIRKLHQLNVTLYATGGTQEFIEQAGLPVVPVESVTEYPSILGGRVKTLHPKIFGGILSRRHVEQDLQELDTYTIPEIDLVIVDLYPFEETLASGASEEAIIEKIDIGGISLIRAAAKNFKDVLIVSSRSQYTALLKLLEINEGASSLEERKYMAAEAFHISSHYDTAIFHYFNQNAGLKVFKESIANSKSLRYGENPHQQGMFFGKPEELFEQLHGKEISYNNLLDIDAALNLIQEFGEPTVAILKHNNACGLASRDDLSTAWQDALAGDPVSAFGGIIAVNGPVDAQLAEKMNSLFFEVLIAPSFSEESLVLLMQKKNRILLRLKNYPSGNSNFRSLLNGVVWQEKDLKTESLSDLKTVTNLKLTPDQSKDLVFALKISKHTKSNTIVLAKNRQLLGSGTGQTSRVDALRQAIQKAENFGFDLRGAVMASDAFFPFPDCVEIAGKAGIRAVAQPGGSVKDQDSIDYCNQHDMAMAVTGIRHFKH